jgi:hypothetical protein
LSGKCNETAAGCYTNNYCPYNHYCNATSTPGKCIPMKTAGADCVKDDECGIMVQCLNSKCTPLFSLTEGQSCTYSSQCSGCLGCNSIGSNPGNCTNALTKIQTYGIPCTADANCTGIGEEDCQCEYSSSAKKCVVQNPIITYGANKLQKAILLVFNKINAKFIVIQLI